LRTDARPKEGAGRQSDQHSHGSEGVGAAGLITNLYISLEAGAGGPAGSIRNSRFKSGSDLVQMPDPAVLFTAIINKYRTYFSTI
jgi:hypothetical protein